MCEMEEARKGRRSRWSQGFRGREEGSELETSRDATSQKRNGTKTTSGSKRIQRHLVKRSDNGGKGGGRREQQLNGDGKS
jgi:hypothetical protein